MANQVLLKIRRQAGPSELPYWEEFAVPHQPNLNVVAALMEIQLNPVNAQGQRTSPVVWDCSCLEEVCGACSMRINGKARQACSALVDQLTQPIVLEPLSKFPVVRDLMVDRQILFEHLKRVKAWIEVDGYYDMGPGPRIQPKTQEWAYMFSRCMSCGCCTESCPQVNSRTSFMGPAAMAQAYLFNSHPLGASLVEERLAAVMGEGGIAECGKAQNCVRACPKGIPLTDALAEISRDTIKQALRVWRRS